MAIGQIKIIYTYLQVEINILQHALDNSFKGERRKVMMRGIPDWVVVCSGGAVGGTQTVATTVPPASPL